MKRLKTYNIPHLTPSDTVVATSINTSTNTNNNQGPRLSGSRGRHTKGKLKYQKQRLLSRQYSALSGDTTSFQSLRGRREQKQERKPLSTTAEAAEGKAPDPIYNDVRVNRQSSHVLNRNNGDDNNNNNNNNRPGNRPEELHKSTDSIGVCSRLLDDNGLLRAQRRKSRIQGIAALGRDSQIYGYSEYCPSFHTEAVSSIHVGESGMGVESVFDYAGDPVLTSAGGSSVRNTDENTMNSAEIQSERSHPAMEMNAILGSQNELDSSVLWMHGLGLEHESGKFTGWGGYSHGLQSEYPSSTAQQMYLPGDYTSKFSGSDPSSPHFQSPRCMFYSNDTGAVYAQSLHSLVHSDKGIGTLLESEMGTTCKNQNSADKSGFFWIDNSGLTEKDIRNLGDVFELHPLTIQDMVQGCARDKIDNFPDYTFVAYHSVLNGEGMRIKSANQTKAHLRSYYRSCWNNSSKYGLRRSSNLDNCGGTGLITNNHRIRFSCAQLLDNIDNGSDDGRRDEASDTIYIVMKENYVLSFHTGKGRSVAERVLQRLSALHAVVLETAEGECCGAEPLLKLAEYPPYIVYAMLDEVTDQFSPRIMEIERQVDDIDRLVLLLSHESHERMLQRMGEQRRDILQTWQAIQAKPAVIMALAEQQTEAGSQYLPAVAAEVTQYFGDIHSHLVAAIETCARAEAVLSRSHSNYLAKISLEMSKATYESNTTTERWTLLGVIVVPINIVTSFLGINLKVPGQDRDDTLNFFVLLACMLIYTFVMLAFWRWRQLA
ncbi:CorA metal ion transporter [Coemansia sp. RSA 1843]|nr:CorA metal ion transporter [Coemansia sp. RSA 1843]